MIPKFDVFIIYNTLDGKDLADHTKETLEGYQVEAFVAAEDTPIGEAEKKFRYNILENADYVIVILTLGILKSKEVKKELKFANEHNKSINPFLHNDVTRGRAEEFFSSLGLETLQWAEFDTREDLARKVEAWWLTKSAEKREERPIYFDGLISAKNQVLDPFVEGLKLMKEYQWSGAIRKFRMAMKKARGTQKVALSGLIGLCYYQQSNYKEALINYRASLSLARRVKDRLGIATNLHNIGIIHQDQGEYAKARELYEQSLKIKKELGDKSGIAITLHQLAMIHHQQGEYAKARELYEQSLKIKKELGDKSGIAITLHQLATIHQDQGDYANARELYEQSLRIKKELGDKSGIAITLHQLAMIHQDQGEYAEARELYEQSLKIFTDLGAKREQAAVLHQFGIIYQEQGEYERARELYEQSLKIFTDLGAKREQASVLHQLGRIHQDQGEYAKARELYEQSLKIQQELGDKSGIAITLGQLGRLAEKRGDDRNALKNYLIAFSIFNELKSPDKETVNSWIAGMRERLGEERFNELLESVKKEIESEKSG